MSAASIWTDHFKEKITCNPRLVVHLIARIDVENFTSRTEAIQAERRAIRTEQPPKAAACESPCEIGAKRTPMNDSWTAFG